MFDEADTICALLGRGAELAPALGAPDRPPLGHGALRALVRRGVDDLNAMGLGHGDRVAIVLPNGPEMAAAFLTVGSGATAAPLNPNYRADEFDFYLSDLDARALVILAGADSPAREVATRRGIPLIELALDGGGAGSHSLRPTAPFCGTTVRGGFATPDDVALVLHTSGTTSRPKIVPLTHANVAASATNIAASLALGTDDVCLNIMPLFHIHGLIGATLASLAAGASVWCTPGFHAFRFFSWFEQARPSWYTAVPTMHEAILQLASRHQAVIGASRLRFVRSSSASLPPRLMRGLEAAFGVPVIEAYGMTEASHQIAANPLPPWPRYAGSVGVAAGPDVAIMAEKGTALLPAGRLGEVVIRGRTVTAGYENNPDANAASFVHGWFRTGDQGVIDETGYLRLTGRLKELINRGGEKVSPLEVDAVLMDHPAVRRCVAFAVPHDKLGEEVAAAIILYEGASATDRELRDFASGRLASFKVPRKIVFLEEIPKGPTGKQQRLRLAQTLGFI